MKVRLPGVLLVALVSFFAGRASDGFTFPRLPDFVPIVVPRPAPPFPVNGLTVLVTYESEKASSLTSGQRAILFGRDVRDFLDAKAAMGSDGRTREYRIWDDDTDASAESETWQKAMAVPRQSEAWVVAVGPKGWESKPLPQSPEEFKALVGKCVE